MKVKILISFLISLAIVGCSQQGIHTINENTSAEFALSDNDEISYVVLSELLNRFDTTTVDTKAAFVSIAKSDPSPQLLEQIQKRWPTLRPISESHLDEVGSTVKDRFTGKLGIIYSIRTIHSVDENTVKVLAGHYRDNLDASSCEYEVRRKGSSWTVYGKAECRIS